jgi:hypothetical protein
MMTAHLIKCSDLFAIIVGSEYLLKTGVLHFMALTDNEMKANTHRRNFSGYWTNKQAAIDFAQSKGYSVVEGYDHGKKEEPKYAGNCWTTANPRG